MTALSQYQRLESQGLWRATADAQRLNVIVSFGNATLVLSDKNETPLTHWSLPAITRVNPGAHPAIFAPGPDAAETLELDDSYMIEAIETVRTAVARGRSKPGRLRLIVLLLALGLALALSVFWLPDALNRYTASIVPAAKRIAIGQALLDNISRVSGAPCTSAYGTVALDSLSRRLLPAGDILVVLPSGGQSTRHLPGGYILLGRALVEDFDEPDVVAGYVLAEMLRARGHDPLVDLLEQSGLGISIRLLTTGEIPAQTLARYAEKLLQDPVTPVADEALLKAFDTAGVRATPYAFALDVTGESTIGLIEADPYGTTPPAPLLSDGAWVSLQGICGA